MAGMSVKTVETILTGWRKLERDLATADSDAREEIQARIAELRDQYQAAFRGAESDGAIRMGESRITADRGSTSR